MWLRQCLGMATTKKGHGWGGGGVSSSSSQTCHYITSLYTFFVPPSLRILLLRLAVVLLQCFSDPVCQCGQRSTLPAHPMPAMLCNMLSNRQSAGGDKAGHLQRGRGGDKRKALLTRKGGCRRVVPVLTAPSRQKNVAFFSYSCCPYWYKSVLFLHLL